MGTTARRPQQPGERVGTKVGYLVAVAVNLVVLWVVGNLLDWGWPSFLTPAFDDLLPIVEVSLVASAAVNLVWVVWDPEWFHHLAQLGLNAIGMVVTVRTWQVFPFDLSSGWETTFRVGLVLCAIAIGIATVVETVKLVGSLPAGRSHGSGAAA